MNKIVEKAIKAKENGYKYMASIVKSVYTTRYYHVVSIDDVISCGKWIPANYVQFASGARGRVGTQYVDWSITIRK